MARFLAEDASRSAPAKDMGSAYGGLAKVYWHRLEKMRSCYSWRNAIIGSTLAA
jgi:hypothetical protein